jgi:hypothetical protein
VDYFVSQFSEKLDWVNVGTYVVQVRPIFSIGAGTKSPTVSGPSIDLDTSEDFEAGANYPVLRDMINSNTYWYFNNRFINIDLIVIKKFI